MIPEQTVNQFFRHFEGIRTFYEALREGYNPARPYDPKENNPARPLIYALSATGHDFSPPSLVMATLDEFEAMYGKENPLLGEVVRATAHRFDLLERAVRDNMGWNDVKKEGGCSRTLDYLFTVPSERVKTIHLTTEALVSV